LSFPSADFGSPAGEPALADPASVSWRIFKNPVALFAGGVAAVLLELAEPRVRSGVWEHTDFRRDPVRRLERTGLAAMVTVYGARSVAERMITGVVARHERVQGTTPAGAPYRANDPALLAWVQATAAFGFIEAYRHYVRPLAPAEIDRAYAEGVPAAALYGVREPPRSDAERQALFEATRPRLEPSPIVFEFLAILRDAPIVPWGLRPLQRLLIRAAVELVPDWVRDGLGLGPAFGLRGWERRLVRLLGMIADRVVLPGSPAVQSCLRLGLPAGHLYQRRGSG
jgi:uncharacterized protein (DUF2236 family)